MSTTLNVHPFVTHRVEPKPETEPAKITKDQLAAKKLACEFSQETLDAWVQSAKNSFTSVHRCYGENPYTFLQNLQTLILDGYRLHPDMFPIITHYGHTEIAISKPEAQQAAELEQVIVETTASYYESLRKEREEYAEMCGEFAVQESRIEAEEKQAAKEAKLREQAIKLALEIKSL
jgi:hypothetical protein